MDKRDDVSIFMGKLNREKKRGGAGPKEKETKPSWPRRQVQLGNGQIIMIVNQIDEQNGRPSSLQRRGGKRKEDDLSGHVTFPHFALPPVGNLRQSQLVGNRMNKKEKNEKPRKKSWYELMETRCVHEARDSETPIN